MKKSVVSNNASVNVPVYTLNALKTMLFNTDKGVNLSTIINDLSKGENDDLTAINVALTYKGVRPNIDTNHRYNGEWSQVVGYEFNGFSLILGKVRYIKCYKYYNKENDTFDEWTSEDDVREMDYSEWLALSTSEEEAEDTVRKHFKKEETAI